MGTLNRKAVWGAALALWMLIPAATVSADNGSGKVDKLLREVASDAPQAVIIRTRPEAKDRVRNRLSKRGRTADHQLISGFGAELTRREIAAAADDPDVLSVSVDADVTASSSFNSNSNSNSKKNSGGDSTTTVQASVNPEWATVSALRQSLGIHESFTGSGMTVAVIDSGIQNSVDFSGRIVGAYDFTSGKTLTVTPTDEYGHGTHVAGLIASSGATSSGKYAGVAPAARLLSLKVLDKKGAGKTSSVIAALEFAVANKNRFGIKIVNLSLGHPIYESAASDPLVLAVEQAVRSGLIVVVAAGNFGTNPNTGVIGYAGIASPGNAPSAITVGASNTAGTLVRTDDRVAPFSSRGPSWYDGIAKPDVVAPGTGMRSNLVTNSTLATTYKSLVVTEGGVKFLKLDGSSMATAVVSGLTAVMLEANHSASYQRWQLEQLALRKNQRTDYQGTPALTANAVKAMLEYSATPLRDAAGVRYDALTQGSGEVNGVGALALSYLTDTTRPVGSFWMTAQWPPYTNFGGVDEAWSQNIVWGTVLVHGSSIVDVRQAAWADNIVWGTGQMDDNIVWGTVNDDDNIVWGTLFGGDNIVWGTLFGGDNIVWGTLFGGNASFGDNIVWGTSANWGDNIVWGTGLLGTFNGENIVWGTQFGGGDNIVWGTLNDDNIVWGTSANKVTILGTTIGGGL